MLKIEAGNPWIMWPDNVVENFINFPANKIFDYDGNFEINLIFSIFEKVNKKAAIFSKLPSYFGFDLEVFGAVLTVTEITKNVEYVVIHYNWIPNKKYNLKIKKINNKIDVYINGEYMNSYSIVEKLAKDSHSHIIFGSGNFPENNFNLNYLSYNLYFFSIKKDGNLICKHTFTNFIHNKSIDLTGNCNFIHKIC